MALILRIDVDKAYGRATNIQKVLSRIRENYWMPAIELFGYLNDLERFLAFLANHHIYAHLYFRKCTLPRRSWLDQGFLDGHMVGFHAEDTRSYDSFRTELDFVRSYFFPRKVTSFTKHGSGKWKGGRNHYPYYEPDKYLKWAESLGISFFSGNLEDINEPCIVHGSNHFYPSAFWIERAYKNNEQFSLQQIIDIAKERNLIVLIHSGSFEVDNGVKRRMRRLITLAQQQNVSWITL